MTRRSTVSTAVRARVAPPVPLPPAAAPLPPPVQRAINRTPVPEEDWEEYEDSSFEMVPLPGGCLFNFGPRRAYW